MSIGGGWFAGISQEEIIWAASLEEVGTTSWQKIYRSYKFFKSFLANVEGNALKLGLSPKQAAGLKSRTVDKSSLTPLKKHNIEIVTIDSQDYPTLLREIDDPPLWLFVRGNKKAWQGRCITVVGSRTPSAYGRAALEKVLPPELARELVVCSGLAYGIDSLAHRLSLEAGGRTIAVLAGGLDKIYPSSHTFLAQQIVEKGGALLSEYPPGLAPRPYRFPVRNRILAGLSPLTAVIEARLHSGTLTTARSALDYNRDLFALPGDITRPTAEGPNYLLSRGASVLSSSAVLAEYFSLNISSEEEKIDSQAKKILNLLDKEAKSLDDLVGEMNRPVQEVLGLLTKLELEDLVYQTEINYYARKK